MSIPDAEFERFNMKYGGQNPYFQLNPYFQVVVSPSGSEESQEELANCFKRMTLWCQ